jgi:menaquinone-9 beta-reductase
MNEAVKDGAQVRTGCYVKHISGNTLTYKDDQGKTFSLEFDHLIGADGSTSLVRRHLGIPANGLGVGINYQIPGIYDTMEWHLNTARFGSGYGWIFPHRDTISIGAYATRGTMNPDDLKRNLVAWAKTKNFDLSKNSAKAEFINYDYRGFEFGKIWLVGDAAGLASGLTGEGINPAIVSGQEVAKKIIDPSYQAKAISQIVKKQKRHARVISLASSNKLLCTLLMESLILMLRFKLVDFQKELSM